MNKYLRVIRPSACKEAGKPMVDVYDVLVAFDVFCPARAHAIKKLLCAGLRGKNSEIQDLRESLEAVSRAVDLQELREGEAVE
jgi:hypothetical protein